MLDLGANCFTLILMESQLLCPLCKSVSPGDASACVECGAIFAQTSAVGTAAAPWELPARQASHTSQATAAAPPPVTTSPPPVAASAPPPPAAAPATAQTGWAPPAIPDAASQGWGIRQQRGHPAKPLLDMPLTPLAPNYPVNKPPAAARRSGVGWPSWVAAILVAVGIVAVGLFGAAHGWFGSGSSSKAHNTLVTPDVIAGAPALPNSSWSQIASGIRTGLSYDPGITRTVSSVYGTAASPQLIFVGEQGSAVNSSTTAQGLQRFAALSNYLVDASSEVNTTAAGVPYVCGVVSGGSPSSICAFTDGQTRGFVWVVTSADLNHALSTTEAAHSASLK